MAQSIKLSVFHLTLFKSIPSVWLTHDLVSRELRMNPIQNTHARCGRRGEGGGARDDKGGNSKLHFEVLLKYISVS